MRKGLKRINIVLTDEQHPRFREFARRYHGSLSQLLRAAAENEIERNQNGGDTVEIDATLRPLVERLEELEKTVKMVEKRLEKTGRGVDFLVDRFGDKTEKISDDIEELLLREGRELSVPDMGDFLPYSQSEILHGIEKLEDEFAVVRAERENGPTRWKIKGGASGD